MLHSCTLLHHLSLKMRLGQDFSTASDQAVQRGVGDTQGVTAGSSLAHQARGEEKDLSRSLTKEPKRIQLQVGAIFITEVSGELSQTLPLHC